MRWRNLGVEEHQDGGAMGWRSHGMEEPRGGGALGWRSLGMEEPWDGGIQAGVGLEVPLLWSMRAWPAVDSVTHDAWVESAAPCLSISRRASLIRRLRRDREAAGTRVC